MSEGALALPLMVLLVGVAIALSIAIKAGTSRLGLPNLLGYLLLGFLLRLADAQWQFLSPEAEEIFVFLAELGIISLLFRVGLESDLAGLKHQLPRASKIWLSDIIVSGGLGFVTAYFLLNLSAISSIFVAVAFTATSVGVSIGVWEEENATDSPNGQLLLDVAEMDDISAVILMALLFAIAPNLSQSNDSGSLVSVIAETSGIFAFKAVVFGTFCFFFSRYFEAKMTKFFREIEPAPDPMLEVVGIGFIIAAIAGLLGFSVAIGGFFAGLVFSRDPQAVKMEASFQSIYELLTPFFFIGIGLKIDPTALTSAVGMGLILLIAAVLGKVLGAGGLAYLTTSKIGGILIGVSMIPRAEITMIVMQRGLKLGSWAVSEKIFAAMVLVSAATSIIAPLALRSLLHKWPQKQGETP
ncbi:cation:proton antiporter [Phormidium sp. CCY1219]|uniref:cation:proton antiporter n=1 Tax=Phormidium sp. CCY1219 TaxID=2886104 RepID=UPI002D1E637D|nr:cation:proton antiporter [Phormidium sp. CCY1219]MEB3829610.1 cation:proton antiporter [Phormidium sp. CCY1219]